MSDAPAEVQAGYTDVPDALAKATAQAQSVADSADIVCEAVREALTTGRPKTRQTVGRDACIVNNVLRRLPDRLRDSVVRRLAGYPG